MNIVNREMVSEKSRQLLVQAGAWQVYRINLRSFKQEQEPVCYLDHDVSEAEIRQLADRPGVLCLVNVESRVVAIACAAQLHESSLADSD